jgi:uncharacterized OsmC-like protein
MGEASRAIVVTHEKGVEFAVEIGRHRLIVDQPERAGGTDAGPSPIQLLGASLGSCVALYVRQFCETRGLPYQGMRVEVVQTGAQHPNRISEFTVRVVMPQDLPDPYPEKLDAAIRTCPAYNTLARGAEVEILIGAAIAVG